jgi:hypothetical protein
VELWRPGIPHVMSQQRQEASKHPELASHRGGKGSLAQPPTTAKAIHVLKATQRLPSNQRDEGTVTQQLLKLTAAEMALDQCMIDGKPYLPEPAGGR